MNHKHLSLRRNVIPPRYFTCTFIKKAEKVGLFGGKYMVAQVIWKIYANNVKKRKTWALSAKAAKTKGKRRSRTFIAVRSKMNMGLLYIQA